MGKALVKHDDPIRAMAAASQTSLMATVSTFGQYVDNDGKHASSEKGLVLTINRAVKKYYGMARDEMPRDMLLHVSSALDRVVQLIARGMAERQSRREIKDGIKATIKAFGESYHALGGSHVHY
jgi:hypothetical protein